MFYISISGFIVINYLRLQVTGKRKIYEMLSQRQDTGDTNSSDINLERWK